MFTEQASPLFLCRPGDKIAEVQQVFDRVVMIDRLDLTSQIRVPSRQALLRPQPENRWKLALVA